MWTFKAFIPFRDRAPLTRSEEVLDAQNEYPMLRRMTKRSFAGQDHFDGLERGSTSNICAVHRQITCLGRGSYLERMIRQHPAHSESIDRWLMWHFARLRRSKRATE